jgi:hypothetical protein
VVKQCFVEVPRPEVLGIRDDLESWLIESADESSPNLPPVFGCDYESSLDGLTDRQWVQEMVAEFEHLLGK